MNLVDLVLTVCVAASESDCRTEHIHFEQEGTLLQCTLRAPGYIAQWSQDHPEFKVVRWRCAPPDGGSDI